MFAPRISAAHRGFGDLITRVLIPPLCAGVLVFAVARPAQAQATIPGSYAPFSVTLMKAGIAPPQRTVVLENGSVWYTTKVVKDSAGNVVSSPNSTAYVNRTTVGYVPKFEILGGDFYPAVFVMFMDQLLRTAPDSQKDFQLADLVVQPIALGWHFDNWHVLTSYNLWIPTGRFEEGAGNNTGKGLYSHMLTAGATWLQATDLPWATTAQLRYEFFGKQKTTNIRPGQVMTLEGAFGKEVFGGFDLGVAFYYSFQTTTEEGSAPGTDLSRYRYAGAGPEFHWRPKGLPGAQVSLRASYEFAARNTTEGIGVLLSFVYTFGLGR